VQLSAARDEVPVTYPVYSALEKRKAVEREIARRKRVYPNRLLTGRMSQHRADLELAIFEDIRADYARLEEAERFIG